MIPLSLGGPRPAECAGCGRVLHVEQEPTVVRDHEARLWHAACYAKRVRANEPRRKKGR